MSACLVTCLDKSVPILERFWTVVSILVDIYVWLPPDRIRHKVIFIARGLGGVFRARAETRVLLDYDSHWLTRCNVSQITLLDLDSLSTMWVQQIRQEFTDCHLLKAYLIIIRNFVMMFYIIAVIKMNRLTGLVRRVFANGPRDRGSIPGRVIPKTFKMVLDISLLNTPHYKVRIKGKVEQSWERSSIPHPGVVAIEKGAFELPSTTLWI